MVGFYFKPFGGVTFPLAFGSHNSGEGLELVFVRERVGFGETGMVRPLAVFLHLGGIVLLGGSGRGVGVYPLSSVK